VQVTNAGICESMPQAQVDPSASQVQAVEVRDVGMRNGETYAAAYSLYDPPLDRLRPRPTSHLISSHRTRTHTCTHTRTRIPSPPPSSPIRSLHALHSPRSRQNHPKEHQQAHEAHHLTTHIQQPVPHPHPLLLRPF
jgi:hypothetical protein